MATPSLRKRIRLALVERLRAIRQTNGYHTDGGLRVLHGEPLATSEQDTAPRIGLVVGEMPEGERRLDDQELRQWSMTAHGAVSVDPTDPLALPEEDLLEDLKVALFAGDRTLGGLVQNLVPAAGETTTAREEGSTSATCALPFVVWYTERPGRPVEAEA